MTPEQIIESLGLSELPIEGGYFGQSYRDASVSAIYYLLRAPDYSGMHVLDHLEIYNYHAGSPLQMILLHPDGTTRTPLLGPQNPQVVVPAGVWQGSRPTEDWSFVGTVVVPPYTDEIVTFGHADELTKRYPEHAGMIKELCRF